MTTASVKDEGPPTLVSLTDDTQFHQSCYAHFGCDCYFEKYLYCKTQYLGTRDHSYPISICKLQTQATKEKHSSSVGVVFTHDFKIDSSKFNFACHDR